MKLNVQQLAMGAVIATAALSPVAHAAKWAVTDLGPVALQSKLYVNNLGQVAGTFSNHPQGAGPYTAFITGPNGDNRRDLYTDNTLESIAIGINDAGQVLSQRGSNDDWLYQVANINSSAPTFQTISRSHYGYGLGNINAQGKVVGNGGAVGSTPDLTYLAFSVNADGSSFTPLTNGQYPIGVTSTGAIVFNSDGGGITIAKSATAAATKVNVPTGSQFIHAYGMNDKAQVVGEYRLSDNSPRAFVTGASGSGITTIGTLGSRLSYSMGVGANGVVVGSFGNNFDFWHAMITDAGGKNPRDLAAEVTLPNGGYLTTAYSINDKGQVVATDYYNGRAYLLTPIGESDCAVNYKRTVLSNKSVFTQVTVSNLTATALSGWSVNWRIDTASKLSAISGASVTMSGNEATAAPAKAPSIKSKAQVSFSFLTTAIDGNPTVADVRGQVGGKTCKVILP